MSHFVFREKEVYITQPDFYFYHGGSKTGTPHSCELFLEFVLNVTVEDQNMHWKFKN